MRSWRAVMTGLLVCAAATAQAVDGVIEINDACARATAGCFPNDGQGYPVRITSGGNYRLTSNLVVPPGVTGIEVGANLVTVDLNGFTILGPVVCANTSTCTGGGGAGRGVSVDGGAYGVSVVNGRIEGFASHGILLGAAGRVERVYVAGIGDPAVPTAVAIEVNEGSIVERVEVQVVRGAGITAPSSLVFDSIIRDTLVWAVAGEVNRPAAVRGLYIFRVGQSLALSAQLGPSYCGNALC